MISKRNIRDLGSLNQHQGENSGQVEEGISEEFPSGLIILSEPKPNHLANELDPQQRGSEKENRSQIRPGFRERR